MAAPSPTANRQGGTAADAVVYPAQVVVVNDGNAIPIVVAEPIH